MNDGTEIIFFGDKYKVCPIKDGGGASNKI